MASRLASGGINLAASASSHHVSAAAGPDVNYCRPTDGGGRDETKQDACRRGALVVVVGGCVCVYSVSVHFHREENFPPFVVGFRRLLLLLFFLLHE